MDEDGTEHAEAYYYNFGYDGVYKPKEKAIIFECVGRGVKLPPLSQMSFPSSISKNDNRHSTNVRPSYVLGLMAPAVTTQELNLCKEPTDRLQCSQNNQHNDIHSESSDLDMYISDEDDTVDECDSHLAKTDYPPQNPFETLFLPSNVICHTECSSSGNRLVLSETDAAKNGKDDSATSDDEIFSNPSFADDSESDSEDISVATNNLNQTISSTVGKNSTNNINNRGGEKNIYLDENISLTNTSSLGVSDSCHTSSLAQQQTILGSDDSNPSETVCLEEKSSAVEGTYESSSSNGSNDLISEMFSSDENEDNIANHFRTYNRNTDVDLSLACPDTFPQLSTKQTLKTGKPQKSKCKVKSLPTGPLTIKGIAKLVLSNPSDEADASGKNVNVETNKDSKTRDPGVLVIENLPPNYEKGHLDSFLQVFGKVENITLIPFYDKMTARIKMAGDLDWAVDCINDSNAFGAGEEPLRCYLE